MLEGAVMDHADEVNRQILEAAEDPDFRAVLFSDPDETLDDLTGDQHTKVFMGPEQRALLSELLDRASTDARFREQLMEDPHRAIDSAGLGERYRAAKTKSECLAWSLIYRVWW
jgi:hypothetical protein